MDTPTSAKFKELWKIRLSTKDEFQLTGSQFQELKRRMAAGDLGIVDLGEQGGFKISHIVCWWCESRTVNESNRLESGTEKVLSEEERNLGRKKMEELREKHFSN